MAASATWHAARLLRDGIRKLDNWGVDEMFHYPWCLYLATLVCWALYNATTCGPPSTQSSSGPITPAFGTISNTIFTPSQSVASRRRRGSAQSMDHDDEDSDWDSRTEMNVLISAMTRLNHGKEGFARELWDVARKLGALGLVRCMVKHLNTVRWAVVREGMIVLRGLLH